MNRPLIVRWFTPQAVSTRQLHSGMGVYGAATVTQGVHGSGFVYPGPLTFHRDLMVEYLDERPAIWENEPVMTAEYLGGVPHGHRGFVVSNIEKQWMDALDRAHIDPKKAEIAGDAWGEHLDTLAELRPDILGIGMYGICRRAYYAIDPKPEIRAAYDKLIMRASVRVLMPACYVAGNITKREKHRNDCGANVHASLMYQEHGKLVCPTVCTRYGASGNTPDRLVTPELLMDMVTNVALGEYDSPDGTKRRADGVTIYTPWDGNLLHPEMVAADNALVEMCWEALK